MQLGLEEVEIIDKRVIADVEQSPCEPSLLHPYPGSMPAFLAARLIERYSKKGDTVLDPFCGTGAVLVESLRLKRQCVGVDLLHSSVRIATAAVNLPIPELIEKEWERLRNHALSETSLFRTKQESVPISLTQNLREWFHPRTASEIAALFEHIGLLESETIREVLLLLLAGSLLSLSRRKSRGIVHWGWIADNVVPKSTDLVYVNAYALLEDRLQRLLSFMRAANSSGLSKMAERVKVFQHNWLSENTPATQIPEVDLLLTSPPYPYSIDYTLAMRLTHYLLGYDVVAPRENEIGARFKRKRKDRTDQYLEHLGQAITKISRFVKVHGFAVFVLPDPSGYKDILGFGLEKWLEYIGARLEGGWKLCEVGKRNCGQRRIVHPNREARIEVVVAYKKESC